MVVPMMETWIVVRAVKQADEGRDKLECIYDFYFSNV